MNNLNTLEGHKIILSKLASRINSFRRGISSYNENLILHFSEISKLIL